MDLTLYSKYQEALFSKIDCIIDIGVSTGSFIYDSIAYFQDTTRVIGIDPLDYVEFKRWEKIEFHKIGIGLSCDVVDFYQSIDNVGSSTMVTEGIKTRIIQRRMDCFLKTEEIQGNLFVKLDTQGTEIDCLASFGEDIVRVRAIQIETWMKPYGNSGRYFDETIGLIDSLGFYVAEIFEPVYRSKDNMLGQVDLLCINKGESSYRDLDW